MPNIAAFLFPVTNPSPRQGWVSQGSEDEGPGVLIQTKKRGALTKIPLFVIPLRITEPTEQVHCRFHPRENLADLGSALPREDAVSVS